MRANLITHRYLLVLNPVRSRLCINADTACTLKQKFGGAS